MCIVTRKPVEGDGDGVGRTEVESRVSDETGSYTWRDMGLVRVPDRIRPMSYSNNLLTCEEWNLLSVVMTVFVVPEGASEGTL